MNENANNRLKNFLVNGFQGLDIREADMEEAVRQDQEDIEGDEIIDEIVREPVSDAQTASDQDAESLKAIESELIRIRYMLEDLNARPAPTMEMPDLSAYLTTREQSKAINATVSKIEASASNKALVKAMEQISAMREDFFKLCEGMKEKIKEMDAETVLSSFEAYEVDMENILTDADVYIGKFDFEKLNTLHQRIVGVVPTGEKEKDGTIAERQSNGYKLGDKVLLKERVTVYKYNPSMDTSDAPKAEPGSEEVPETSSENVSKTAEQESGKVNGTLGSMEEKE